MQTISGSAMLVSAMSGFSSSYNAVALMGCDIMPADTTTSLPLRLDDPHCRCCAAAVFNSLCRAQMGAGTVVFLMTVLAWMYATPIPL